MNLSVHQSAEGDWGSGFMRSKCNHAGAAGLSDNRPSSVAGACFPVQCWFKLIVSLYTQILHVVCFSWITIGHLCHTFGINLNCRCLWIIYIPIDNPNYNLYPGYAGKVDSTSATFYRQNCLIYYHCCWLPRISITKTCVMTRPTSGLPYILLIF